MTKIDCPPIRLSESEDYLDYLWTLNIWAILTICINFYVIICILFRSTKHMQQYKWYLLHHQVAALVADLFISAIGRPMALLPFPIGFSAGIFDSWSSCSHLIPLATLIEGWSMITILLLFIYRRNVAYGTGSPCWMTGLLIFVCISIVACSVNEEFAYSKDEVLVYHQKYTCIDDSILKMSNICAYNPMSSQFHIFYPLLALMALASGFMFYLIWVSYRAINVKIKSVKLKMLQRKFLLQVVVQCTMPIFVFIVPATFLVFIVITQTFDMQPIFYLAVYTISSFSSISGLVLIAMNKSYYGWIFCLWKKNAAHSPTSVAPEPYLADYGRRTSRAHFNKPL